MAETKTSGVDFAVQVRDEMKKVTWPDWPQLKNSTGVIVVFVLLVSAVIFGIDAIVALLLQGIRALFGGA